MSENTAQSFYDLFDIKTNEKYGGKCLIAKKDFVAGELLYSETPLIIFCKFTGKENEGQTTTCGTCYRQCLKSKFVPCKRCLWPFCSKQCSEDVENHCGLECSFLARNLIYPTEMAMRNLYIVKLLQLEEKYPDKWKLISQMTSKPSNNCLKFEQKIREKAIEANDFLKESCNQNVSIGTLEKLIGIEKINSLMMSNTGPNASIASTGRSYHVLYPHCRLLSHSCSASAECRLVVGGEKHEIGIYATRNIYAGEQVTISYSEKYTSLGTLKRQQKLYKKYDFICECIRCNNPDEMLTYFSAFKCPMCPYGWVLPSTSFDNRYICNTCDLYMSVRIVEVVEKAFTKVLNITDEKCSPKDRPGQLDNLIERAASKFYLHPNHYLVVRATNKWLSSIDLNIFTGEKDEKELFEKMIKRAKEALENYYIFGSQTRITLMEFRIACIYIYYYFRSPGYIDIEKFRGSDRERVDVIRTILTHMYRGCPKYHPEVYNPQTHNLVSEVKKRFREWHVLLSDLVDELKEKNNETN